VDLVTQHNYTAMLWGNARSTGTDAMRLDFWEETEPAPADGKVKLRVINATGAAINGWAFLSSGSAGVTPTWANVAPYSASAYVEVDSGTYTYQIQDAALGTNLFSNTTALYGQTPNCDNQSTCQTGQQPDIEAAPGTRVSGSAISGIVFPKSVTGSMAAQFTNPGITYVWDRRPSRSCDPYC
jgi:hypothetical protein